MAKKSTYTIAMIRQGRERDYRDFWEKNLKNNSKGEALDSDVVGFIETVDAKSLEEAISIAQRIHPGLTIVREYSSKLG